MQRCVFLIPDLQHNLQPPKVFIGQPVLLHWWEGLKHGNVKQEEVEVGFQHCRAAKSAVRQNYFNSQSSF